MEFFKRVKSPPLGKKGCKTTVVGVRNHMRKSPKAPAQGQNNNRVRDGSYDTNIYRRFDTKRHFKHTSW